MKMLLKNIKRHEHQHLQLLLSLHIFYKIINRKKSLRENRTTMCSKGGSPVVLICDLMNIQTKELFGGMFENMFQEALRHSTRVSH